MKTYIMVDIEANGPIPGDYSMTSLGAVIVDEKLDKTFKINIKPISEKFDPNQRQFGIPEDIPVSNEIKEKIPSIAKESSSQESSSSSSSESSASSGASSAGSSSDSAGSEIASSASSSRRP